MARSPNSGSEDPRRRVDQVRRLLGRRSMGTDELLAALGVSQPTLSRTIQQVPDAFFFRLTGVRTPRYGLIRSLPGHLSGHQKVYSITASGEVGLAGIVALLAGGETFVQGGDGNRLHAGLPPSIAFAAPSGFLGRQVAHAVAAELHLPPSLRDWSDDHHAAYLVARGWNLPGNLVFGDAALGLALEARKHMRATPAALKPVAFEAMTHGIAEAVAGSSAGGEQPKFLALTEDHGHVIVKFARAGSRMAELLQLEQLSLACLNAAGLPAARAHYLEHNGKSYLEVERFDRQGVHGRIGMISAGALDDESYGKRDSWPEFAERCRADKLLDAEQALRIVVMAAYSELIGNNDRHFENVSLLLDDRGAVRGVSPAYDILPMKYAPIGAGIDPPLVPIEPRVGTVGGNTAAWETAGRAAIEFWTRASHDKALRISRATRVLAARNLEVVQQFVAPLAPTLAGGGRQPRSPSSVRR